VQIKKGALISQDRATGYWPATRSGEDVDPKMEFIGTWNGRLWDCVAEGFGARGSYGNGSIFVHKYNGVRVIGE
jgi:hypothetical protein